MNKQLDENLTCAVCQEEYKDPRALPCLHVYCLKCLDTMMTNNDVKTVSCPLCRVPAKFPDSGSAEGFPSDLGTKRLIEMRKELVKHTRTHRTITPTCHCNGCHSAQVTHFCDTCGPLCSECVKKETSSHKVWRCSSSAL